MKHIFQKKFFSKHTKLEELDHFKTFFFCNFFEKSLPLKIFKIFFHFYHGAKIANIGAADTATVLYVNPLVSCGPNIKVTSQRGFNTPLDPPFSPWPLQNGPFRQKTPKIYHGGKIANIGPDKTIALQCVKPPGSRWPHTEVTSEGQLQTPLDPPFSLWPLENGPF